MYVCVFELITPTCSVGYGEKSRPVLVRIALYWIEDCLIKSGSFSFIREICGIIHVGKSDRREVKLSQSLPIKMFGLISLFGLG